MQAEALAATAGFLPTAAHGEYEPENQDCTEREWYPRGDDDVAFEEHVAFAAGVGVTADLGLADEDVTLKKQIIHARDWSAEDKVRGDGRAEVGSGL